MKSIRFVFILFMILSVVSPAAELTSADKNFTVLKTVPTAVSVYNDRAIVTRKKSVKVERGVVYFQIEDLPLNLDPKSVRVSFGEGDRVRLFYYDLKTNYLQENTEEAVAALQKKLEKLIDERAAIYDRIRNLDEKKRILKEIRIKSVTDNNRDLEVNKIDMEAWSSLIDFYYNVSVKIDDDKRRLNARKKELDYEINQISAELRNYRSQKVGVKVLKVGVESLTTGTISIQISYLMYGASWRPKYEIRTENGKDVEFSYLAEIKQNTGENWNNVKLTLSTAVPSAGIQTPELQTLSVAQYYPRKRSYRSSDEAPSMAKEKSGAGAEMEMAEEEKSEYYEPVAKVEQDFSSTTFQVRRLADIPSDGTGYSVPVLSEKLTAQLKYKAVPLLSPLVYIEGEIRNRLEYPILPGPVSLFVNNSYIGSSHLKRIAPKESFTLPFGPDEKFKITRKKVKEFRQNTTISKNVRITYEYLIEVQNMHDEYITIEVYDRIPVSNDKNIKVEIVKISPDPEKQEAAKPGILVWNLSVKPKQTETIKIEYYIEYPEGVRIEYR